MALDDDGASAALPYRRIITTGVVAPAPTAPAPPQAHGLSTEHDHAAWHSVYQHASGQSYPDAGAGTATGVQLDRSSAVGARSRPSLDLSGVLGLHQRHALASPPDTAGVIQQLQQPAAAVAAAAPAPAAAPTAAQQDEQDDPMCMSLEGPLGQELLRAARAGAHGYPGAEDGEDLDEDAALQASPPLDPTVNTRLIAGLKHEVITQATLLDVISAPGAAALEVTDLFTFWRPQNECKSAKLKHLTSKQHDILYAVSGCLDVKFRIGNLTETARRALQDLYGLSIQGNTSDLQVWYKNRGNKEKSQAKVAAAAAAPSMLGGRRRKGANASPPPGPATGSGGHVRKPQRRNESTITAATAALLEDAAALQAQGKQHGSRLPGYVRARLSGGGNASDAGSHHKRGASFESGKSEPIMGSSAGLWQVPAQSPGQPSFQGSSEGQGQGQGQGQGYGRLPSFAFARQQEQAAQSHSHSGAHAHRQQSSSTSGSYAMPACHAGPSGSGGAPIQLDRRLSAPAAQDWQVDLGWPSSPPIGRAASGGTLPGGSVPWLSAAERNAAVADLCWQGGEHGGAGAPPQTSQQTAVPGDQHGSLPWSNAWPGVSRQQPDSQQAPPSCDALWQDRQEQGASEAWQQAAAPAWEQAAQLAGGPGQQDDGVATAWPSDGRDRSSEAAGMLGGVGGISLGRGLGIIAGVPAPLPDIPTDAPLGVPSDLDLLQDTLSWLDDSPTGASGKAGATDVVTAPWLTPLQPQPASGEQPKGAMVGTRDGSASAVGFAPQSQGQGGYVSTTWQQQQQQQPFAAGDVRTATASGASAASGATGARLSPAHSSDLPPPMVAREDSAGAFGGHSRFSPAASRAPSMGLQPYAPQSPRHGIASHPLASHVASPYASHAPSPRGSHLPSSHGSYIPSPHGSHVPSPQHSHNPSPPPGASPSRAELQESAFDGVDFAAAVAAAAAAAGHSRDCSPSRSPVKVSRSLPGVGPSAAATAAAAAAAVADMRQHGHGNGNSSAAAMKGAASLPPKLLGLESESFKRQLMELQARATAGRGQQQQQQEQWQRLSPPPQQVQQQHMQQDLQYHSQQQQQQGKLPAHLQGQSLYELQQEQERYEQEQQQQFLKQQQQFMQQQRQRQQERQQEQQQQQQQQEWQQQQERQQQQQRLRERLEQQQQAYAQDSDQECEAFEPHGRVLLPHQLLQAQRLAVQQVREEESQGLLQAQAWAQPRDEWPGNTGGDLGHQAPQRQHSASASGPPGQQQHFDHQQAISQQQQQQQQFSDGPEVLEATLGHMLMLVRQNSDHGPAPGPPQSSHHGNGAGPSSLHPPAADQGYRHDFLPNADHRLPPGHRQSSDGMPHAHPHAFAQFGRLPYHLSAGSVRLSPASPATSRQPSFDSAQPSVGMLPVRTASGGWVPRPGPGPQTDPGLGHQVPHGQAFIEPSHARLSEQQACGMLAPPHIQRQASQGASPDPTSVPGGAMPPSPWGGHASDRPTGHFANDLLPVRSPSVGAEPSPSAEPGAAGPQPAFQDYLSTWISVGSQLPAIGSKQQHQGAIGANAGAAGAGKGQDGKGGERSVESVPSCSGLFEGSTDLELMTQQVKAFERAFQQQQWGDAAGQALQERTSSGSRKHPLAPPPSLCQSRERSTLAPLASAGLLPLDVLRSLDSAAAAAALMDVSSLPFCASLPMADSVRGEAGAALLAGLQNAPPVDGMHILSPPTSGDWMQVL